MKSTERLQSCFYIIEAFFGIENNDGSGYGGGHESGRGMEMA